MYKHCMFMWKVWRRPRDEKSLISPQSDCQVHSLTAAGGLVSDPAEESEKGQSAPTEQP